MIDDEKNLKELEELENLVDKVEKELNNLRCRDSKEAEIISEKYLFLKKVINKNLSVDKIFKVSEILNKIQYTALRLFNDACTKNNLDTVKFLTLVLQEININNYEVKTQDIYRRGITIALQKKHNDIVKYAAKNIDSNFNWRDRTKFQPPLISAMLAKDNNEMIFWLMDEMGAVIQTDILGNSVITQAAYDGNEELVSGLIKRKVNLNYQEQLISYTEFSTSYSFKKDQDDFIQGVKSELSDRIEQPRARTAIMLAAANNKWTVVGLLLQAAGIDINIVDTKGFSLLTIVLDTYLNDKKYRTIARYILELLLSKGADADKALIPTIQNEKLLLVTVRKAVFLYCEDKELIELFSKYVEPIKKLPELSEKDEKDIINLLNDVMGPKAREKYIDSGDLKWKIYRECNAYHAILDGKKSFNNRKCRLF